MDDAGIGGKPAIELRLPAATRQAIEQLLAGMKSNAEVAIDHSHRGGGEWIEDPLFVDAIAKRVEEIGELAKRLSEHVDEEQLHRMTGIAWRGPRAMRDVLAHGYANLDVRVLKAVVDERLPEIATLDVGAAMDGLSSEATGT